MITEIVPQRRFSRELGLQVTDLDDQPFAPSFMLHIQRIKLTVIAESRDCHNSMKDKRGEYARRTVTDVLQSLGPRLLALELIGEQTNLCLGLFLGTLRLRGFLLLLLLCLLLFSTERLQIATKDLCVFSDAIQFRLGSSSISARWMSSYWRRFSCDI